MSLTIEGRKPWRNKYRNQPVVDPDHGRFDSKREHQRFHILRLMEKAGEISGLQRQVPFKLTVQGHLIATYVADFTYTEKGKFVINDAKGFATPEYKLKKKLMKAIFDWEIVES